MKTIRWGVIGCGGIANKFAASLAALPEGELYAGASRSPGKAETYVEKHQAQVAYSDYESLVNDPSVDVLYVATTHNFHFECVKLCLEHGKHVLCEKPITISARQAKELIELAAEKKLFLMEAMWTRFLPAIRKLQELLADGVIGDVLTVRADFCVGGIDFDAAHRLRNKELAGGALLDLGVYPISFADIVFGAVPTQVQGHAFIGDTEVDDRSFYQLEYEGGRHAQLSSSFTHCAPLEGMVMGSKGYIRVPFFLHARELEICRHGEEPEVQEFWFPDEEGFKFEIAHVMECLAAGKTESDIYPLSKTLAIMQVMDTLREQWNLNYPDE